MGSRRGRPTPPQTPALHTTWLEGDPLERGQELPSPPLVVSPQSSLPKCINTPASHLGSQPGPLKPKPLPVQGSWPLPPTSHPLTLARATRGGWEGKTAGCLRDRTRVVRGRQQGERRETRFLSEFSFFLSLFFFSHIFWWCCCFISCRLGDIF